MFKPEILAPAGSLEKLKIAVLYGADAVYLGGQKYGMRVRADNFTNEELIEGAKFAKERGVVVYVTLNSFLHDSDLDGLGDYCQFLETIGVNAVIVSDVGVISEVKKHSNLNVHLSTQCSCINVNAAIIVGRELSIDDTAKIKEQLDIEVEMFIHGAMCMAYSGNCVISNYTAGRDSNRGGCIQSCRFSYKQTEKKALAILSENQIADYKESFFMSSKDMNGVEYVKHFIDKKIESLKIEGRMKSVFYLATLCRAYRQAVDFYCQDLTSNNLPNKLNEEVKTIPHRDYVPASFVKPAGSDSSYQHREGTVRTGTHQFLGMVLDTNQDFVSVKLNAPISAGDYLEFIPFKGQVSKIKLDNFYTLNGIKLNKSRQDCVVNIPKQEILSDVTCFNVVRGVRQNAV